MALLDLEAIRIRHFLPAVVAAAAKLRRSGREWRACCPFHVDRSPSFTIFDAGKRFHCFGCGASGDVLDYIQRLHQVTLPEAASMLARGKFPTVDMLAPPRGPERDTTAEAASIWRSAIAASGTPVQAYLSRRGLHLTIPPSIRFARLPLGRRKPMPCLVALVVAEGEAVGIQRTFLNEIGYKADLPHGKVKFSLGRVRGGAIRLAQPAAELVIAEGLEDALTLQQELGMPVWAAAGASMLPSMRFPPDVWAVVIGADGDAAGERSARAAAQEFGDRGLSVRIMRPEAGCKDFNEQLSKGGRA